MMLINPIKVPVGIFVKRFSEHLLPLPSQISRLICWLSLFVFLPRRPPLYSSPSSTDRNFLSFSLSSLSLFLSICLSLEGITTSRATHAMHICSRKFSPFVIGGDRNGGGCSCPFIITCSNVLHNRDEYKYS